MMTGGPTHLGRVVALALVVLLLLEGGAAGAGRVVRVDGLRIALDPEGGCGLATCEASDSGRWLVHGALRVLLASRSGVEHARPARRQVVLALPTPHTANRLSA